LFCHQEQCESPINGRECSWCPKPVVPGTNPGGCNIHCLSTVYFEQYCPIIPEPQIELKRGGRTKPKLSRQQLKSMSVEELKQIKKNLK
jgi:hypothetical protein